MKKVASVRARGGNVGNEEINEKVRPWNYIPLWDYIYPNLNYIGSSIIQLGV